MTAWESVEGGTEARDQRDQTDCRKGVKTGGETQTVVP